MFLQLFSNVRTRVILHVHRARVISIVREALCSLCSTKSQVSSKIIFIRVTKTAYINKYPVESVHT